MAFRPKPPPIVADLDIPRLDQDPEHVRLSSLFRALQDGKADRQRQIDLLMIEAEISLPSSGSGRGPRIDALRQRAELLRQALPAPVEAPLLDDDGLPPAIGQGVRLLAGQQVSRPPDRTAKLKQLHDELAILEAAFRAVATLLNDVRSDRSTEVAQSLLPRHHQLLRDLYDAGVALSAAAEAERALIAALILAGYDASEMILQRPGLAAASRVGSLGSHDSDIASFRRRLIEQRIVPE